MKNLLLGLSFGVASLLSTSTPVNSAQNAAIYLHNECYEEIYVEVNWYNQNRGGEDYWSGYIGAYSEAIHPDFYINGANDFYIQGKSITFTWYSDYVYTEHYSNYNYTFYCN